MDEQHSNGQFLSEKRSWAIIASTVILPGVGQVIQKRYVAGGLFMLLFCAGALLLLHAIFDPLIKNLALLFNPQSTAELLPVPWKKILGYAAATTLVYAANLVDTWLAARRDQK